MTNNRANIPEQEVAFFCSFGKPFGHAAVHAVAAQPGVNRRSPGQEPGDAHQAAKGVGDGGQE
jgi:hypothetical protein